MLLLSQDDDTGGDAGAVEELRAEADDRLDLVTFDDLLADLGLVAAAEEDTVRHDRRDHAAVTGDVQHVLQEHEVGFLRTARNLMEETFGELGFPEVVAVLVFVLRAPVDRKRRVGQDPVEAQE